MKATRLLFFLLFISSLSKAQNFGGNPPAKWAQIDTDTVRVIFPRGLDSIANRVATLAHQMQRDSSYKFRYKKINIVLQNNATISNAYVSLAPYRSEFYLMPPQNAFELGALSWADNLVVHEWRHVQQYNYFNRGLSKAAGVVLGQEGRALFNALSVPDWFFEGDAVWNETKYSQQGRGRLASFFNNLKVVDADVFYRPSYMKLRNGSLHDLIPSHYELGYLLVSYGAEKYGNDFWQKVTAEASAFKSLAYPFQRAIKKYTGIPYKKFVEEAFSFYRNQWIQEASDERHKPFTKVNEFVTDYRYPYAFGDSSFIVVKRSAKSNPAFYVVHKTGYWSSTEEWIAAKSISIDDYFSYNNGKIVYAGYNSDLRWTNREFSNIYIFDLATKKEKKITSGAKVFSPDISHLSDKLVAVEIGKNGGCELSLMDVEGKKLRSWNRSGIIFSHPKFSSDDRSVYVFVRNAKGEMALQQFDANDEAKKERTIIPFANHILGFPTIKGDSIVLIGSFNHTSVQLGGRDSLTTFGRDAIWVIDQKTSKIYRYRHPGNVPGFSQAVFGHAGDLVAAGITSKGDQLFIIDKYYREEIKDFDEAGLNDLYVNNVLQSNLDISRVSTKRFSNKPYSKLSHPFNFHSWRPYYDPPEYSFTVFGQNMLNTVATELAYTYNENENNHRLSGNIIYGGTYIQPFIGLSNTWNRRYAFRPDTVAHWNEFEWMAGLQLPLRLFGGKMYRFVNISTGFHANNITFTGSNKNLFRATNINYIQSRISFSSQIQKASMHIFPRFAVSGFLQHRASTNVAARQFLASGSLYLPGFARTHNIVFSFAYQGRDTMRQYAYSNSFPYPRGFDGGYDLPRMWKLGANYHFPLLHPDWGFGNIIYFLRIRANAYTDYAQLQSLRTGAVYTFHTAGGEVFFDSKIWNQLPVTFGVRYNRQITADLVGVPFNQWEIILPVNLIP